ncbi:hypothetical protein ATJ97_2371 [Georgenia soli]|uniref:Uncharacterized protein n=1 Tax=Georgenia soli TaxID=638953 RepID=A0A2A9EM20_9MICO|nr:hypothetical protein [Georgenia soli]PFG39853.1 hypothetical protein ATJ97_2371 [Georgenia soli]
MTVDALDPEPLVAVPTAPLGSATAEDALGRLRATQHDLLSSVRVTEPLLMVRNVAVVQALEAGVPADVVQRVTRMGPAALELAVARGIYHRDHGSPAHARVAGERL